MKVQLVTAIFFFTLLMISRANSADFDTSTKPIKKSNYGQIVTALPEPKFSPLSAGINGNNGNNTANNNCTVEFLNQCWAIHALSFKDGPNIPTTPKEVNDTCSAFSKTMKCAKDYMNQCMNPKQQQAVNASVGGAHEFFRFLCTDKSFREEFLRHSTCFSKISKKYDMCASNFILAQKSVDQRLSKDPLPFCCIRLRFLSCVDELTKLNCDRDSEKFIQKIAQTLVPNVKIENTSKCHQVTNTNCSQSSGSCSTLTQPSSYPLFFNPFKISWISQGFSQMYERFIFPNF